MNKNFKRYVKSKETKVLFRLFLILFFIVLLVFLYTFSGINYTLLTWFILAIFYKIFSITTKKERKNQKKYGVDVDCNNYVVLKNDKQFLEKFSVILETDVNFEGFNKLLVDYTQSLIDKNQVVFIEKNFKLNEVVDSINSLLLYRRYNRLLGIYEILQHDNELIKEKRKKFINNDLNDLAIIKEILQESGISLIVLVPENEGFSKIARIDGYLLTVVSSDKFLELRGLYFDKKTE